MKKILLTFLLLSSTSLFSKEITCSTESLIKNDKSGNYKKIENKINAIHDVVVELSKELELNPCVIISMIAQESSFKSKAQSKVGAKGLMQVMPSTKKYVLKKLGYKTNIFVTRNLNSGLTGKELENILVGSTYFKSLLTKFNGDYNIAVIAYNEGPTRVQRKINNGTAFGYNHNHLTQVQKNMALLAMN